MKRILAVLLICAACTDDGPSGGGVTGDSHVETYEAPAALPPSIDLLLVVDDTTAMATHQQALAALPAQLEQLIAAEYGSHGSYHIGVVTTDVATDGTLRSSASVQGNYVVHEDVFATPMKNYLGSLGGAVASLLPTSAASTASNQPLEQLQRALDHHPANPGFSRDAALLGILIVSASDDASSGAVADYASVVKSTKIDPARVFVSGIFDPAAARLAAFHQQFPDRSDVTSIDEASWGEALVGFTALYKRTLGYACRKPPADLDPVTPGAQYDCSFIAEVDGAERVLPECKGDYSRPCWEFEIGTWCDLPDENAHLQPHGFGDPFHPTVRGQCIVN